MKTKRLLERYCAVLPRALVPALVRFEFEGSSNRLKDLLARIDIPFDWLGIAFFNILVFDIPRVIIQKAGSQ
jgi:hypothetical protein